MKLKWHKTDDTYIEAYLGKWHVISLLKEGDVWKWYSELPFSTTKYSGRRFGSTKDPRDAVSQASKATKEWLDEAGLVSL